MLYATLHAVATPPQGGLTPALGGRKALCSCFVRNGGSSASVGIALQISCPHVATSFESVGRAHISYALSWSASETVIDLRSVCRSRWGRFGNIQLKVLGCAPRLSGFDFGKSTKASPSPTSFPPNKSFKPTPHRGVNSVLYATLHAVAAPPWGGLTPALGTMPTNPFSDEEYKKTFAPDGDKASDINVKALERALDIRKFEIELYWKRATYFWTFIAATFAGFVAVQASNSTNKTDLSVLLCHLGIVFSFSWLCVNRGSKYWQENWEYHVDMLEDKVHGPLYKVVLSRNVPKGANEIIRHLLTGPSPVSVSKINQFISLFITIVWVVLLFYSLPEFNLSEKVNPFYLAMSLLTALTCIAFLTLGRTYVGGYWHQATIRTASIKNGA